MPPLLTWISGLPARLRRLIARWPDYLALQAPSGVRALGSWFLLLGVVPRRQDAPLVVYTMGKVGTVSLELSLCRSGLYFTPAAHRLSRRTPAYPHFSREIRREIAWLECRDALCTRWLRHLPRLRVVTAVREPLARLVSLYLFAYPGLFGEPVASASMETLLARFPRIFAREYKHPLVPAEFFATEIAGYLGVDVYARAFPADEGWAIVEQRNVSLLVLKAEIADTTKERALATWLGRPVAITRHNTAQDRIDPALYAEFKRRVRIPHRYAAGIHASRFMQHFYTPEERAASWRRWEAQLDPDLALPAWIEASLRRYHPPMATDSQPPAAGPVSAARRPV